VLDEEVFGVDVEELLVLGSGVEMELLVPDSVEVLLWVGIEEWDSELDDKKLLVLEVVVEVLDLELVVGEDLILEFVVKELVRFDDGKEVGEVDAEVAVTFVDDVVYREELVPRQWHALRTRGKEPAHGEA
jgi:hypothetical protein